MSKVTIPPALFGFEFILLDHERKSPVSGTHWKDERYVHNSPALQYGLSHGCNYGVVCRDGYIILDIDNMDLFVNALIPLQLLESHKNGATELLEAWYDSLSVFTVRGRHCYLKLPMERLSAKHVGRKLIAEWGDARIGNCGAYVVGPNCTVWSETTNRSKRYTPCNEEIMTISPDAYDTLLALIPAENKADDKPLIPNRTFSYKGQTLDSYNKLPSLFDRFNDLTNIRDLVLEYGCQPTHDPNRFTFPRECGVGGVVCYSNNSFAFFSDRAITATNCHGGTPSTWMINVMCNGHLPTAIAEIESRLRK
jgi:hypothetical protein